MKTRTIKAGVLYRTFELREEDLDKEKRVISMAFSSESPVDRWFGTEILDHGKKSVRLDRLRSGGPLLVDHNPSDVVGVIEDVKLGADRVGRASVRFGKSARAEEIFNDVQDGIRRNVSVGYRVNEMVLEKQDKKKGDCYRVVNWEPLEVSLVSIPADVSVGVGREQSGEEKDITVIDNITQEVRKVDKCKTCGADLVGGACPDCSRKSEVDRARKDENFRIREISALGRKFDKKDLSEKAIEEGTTVDAFRKAIMESIPEAKATPAMQTTEKPKEGFRSLGEFLTAVAGASIPGRRIDPRLAEMTRASGANELVSSEGGFLVQEEFTTDLLAKISAASVIYPKTRKVPIGPNANGLKAPIVDETDRATGSRWGGVQVYRAAEAATVTAKKPKFATLNISLEKLMGLAYCTEELLQDSPAMEAIFSQAFEEEMSFVIDNEILNGTGQGECLGILNAPCLATVAKESGQAAATILPENIFKMYSRMPTRSLPSAEWFINQECWPQLFGMGLAVGLGGSPLFVPPGGISQAPYGTLMGRPVTPVEQCLALGTEGDIYFADFSQYLTISKGGVVGSSSIHVKFLYDEMTYKWTWRINGQPMWTKYLTPYKGSATISPFLSLAIRS